MEKDGIVKFILILFNHKLFIEICLIFLYIYILYMVYEKSRYIKILIFECFKKDQKFVRLKCQHCMKFQFEINGNISFL
jgi:hypothetical protein